MKNVIATHAGFYDGALRAPGDHFQVKDEEDIEASKWFESADKPMTAKEQNAGGFEDSGKHGAVVGKPTLGVKGRGAFEDPTMQKNKPADLA